MFSTVLDSFDIENYVLVRSGDRLWLFKKQTLEGIIPCDSNTQWMEIAHRDLHGLTELIVNASNIEVNVAKK